MSADRKLWPMKWIVLVIILSLGAYTFLTLRYRKIERPFRPYADAKERVTTKRLLAAGYQRIPLDAELPTEGASRDADVASSAGAGLPASLREQLVDQPKLPTEIVSVSAASTVNSMFAYPIGFKCTLPDNRRQLAGAELYVRGNEIVVAPDFDQLAGGLLSRTRENVIRVIVPAGTLKPGSYTVTLAGSRASRTWTLQVH
ncbi:MAG: hypothetical protein JWM35_937 [Verrucomicrobia bacterium]|nr:hypothetical protein [Verrucomicrobiota bacterium]